MASSTELPILQDVECPECGRRSVIAFGDPVTPCPDPCGSEVHIVDQFRDRRRVSAPVRRDRRDSDPVLEVPSQNPLAPDATPE